MSALSPYAESTAARQAGQMPKAAEAEVRILRSRIFVSALVAPNRFHGQPCRACPRRRDVQVNLIATGKSKGWADGVRVRRLCVRRDCHRLAAGRGAKAACAAGRARSQRLGQRKICCRGTGSAEGAAIADERQRHAGRAGDGRQAKAGGDGSGPGENYDKLPDCRCALRSCGTLRPRRAGRASRSLCPC